MAKIRDFFSLILFCSLIFSIPGKGQILVQDATESSSVRFQGNTINFDVLQARTSFTLNHFQESQYLNFWGVQASASAKNGLAKIIDSGKVVPEGVLDINFGRRWSGTNANEFRAKIKKMEGLAKLNGLANKKFAKELDSFIDSLANRTFIGKEDLLKEIVSIKSTKGELELAEAIEKLGKQSKFSSMETEIKKFANEIGMKIAHHYTSRNLIELEIEEKQKEIAIPKTLHHYLIYAIIGAKASKFIYEENPASPDFDQRFIEKKPESLKLGIGFNWKQGGKRIFGANLTWQRTDNFRLLDDNEYTRTSTTTTETKKTATTGDSVYTVVKNDKIEGKKIIVGYSGDIRYGTFDQVSVNLDYTRFYSGVAGDKSVFLVNYYLRQQFSSDHLVYPNVTTAGIGGFFFKSQGKFIGGLYIELNDIFNNIENMKQNPEAGSLYNKVSLGIVTKFSIGSLANVFL